MSYSKPVNLSELQFAKHLFDILYFAGFMTEDELKKLNHLYSDFNKYWMPLAWFANLASQARKEGRVKDDITLRLLMDVRVFKHIKMMHMCNKSAIIPPFLPLLSGAE